VMGDGDTLKCRKRRVEFNYNDLDFNLQVKKWLQFFLFPNDTL